MLARPCAKRSRQLDERFSNSPMLRVEGLQVRHVGPASFSVSAGECVGLSGPSGSGKTLLLRAIADLEAHDGQCLLDGTAAHAMPPSQWRGQVGYLAAESAWWHDTVAPHFPNHTPDNLADLGFKPEVMQWSVARLSTGERQRLALLRLLAGKPRVLLLDEPTANLDAGNSRAMEGVLARYQSEQNAALLWVAHDTDQLKRVATRSTTLSTGGQLTWN